MVGNAARMSSSTRPGHRGLSLLRDLRDISLRRMQVVTESTTQLNDGGDSRKGNAMFEKLQQISVLKLLIICGTIVASLGVLMALVTAMTAIITENRKKKGASVAEGELDEEKVGEMATDPETVPQSTGELPDAPETPEPAI